MRGTFLPTTLGFSILAVVAAPAGAQCPYGWQPDAVDIPGLNDHVYVLTTWDPDGAGPQPKLLIAGGLFRNLQGSTTPSLRGIGAWDGSAWSALGSGISSGQPFAGDPHWVHALAAYNGELIVGGHFTSAGGMTALNVARWNGTNWLPMPGLAAGGAVRALVVYKGELIAGGTFTFFALGEPGNNIARWNPATATWHALGGGANAGVSALTVHNGELIAGGSFTSIGGVPANRIAAWNGTSWRALGSGMTLSSGSADVAELASYQGQLVAAGYFDTAGGVSAAGLARWNGSNWQAFPTWAPVGPVISTFSLGGALGIHDGTLIIGGHFQTIGPFVFNNIARWNGSFFSGMADGVTLGQKPLWPSMTRVLALTVYNGKLIVGGNFKAVLGSVIPADHIATWGTACPSPDLDDNGYVNGLDLAILLGQWTGGVMYAPCPPHQRADLNADCRVNGLDLAILLGSWNP